MSMTTNSPSSLYYPMNTISHHHHHHQRLHTITPLAFSFTPRPLRRRRLTRRLRKHPFFDSTSSSSTQTNKLQFILDVQELKTRTPLPLQRTSDYCQHKLNQFVASSMEAYNDLRTLVVVEPGTNRIVVSCSEATVRFVGGMVVWSCVGIVMVRVLVKLGLGLGFKGRSERGGKVEVVKRRDRSLGGREVVVERRVVEGGERKRNVNVDVGQQGKEMPKRSRREHRKVPRWWPVIEPRTGWEGDREEYRRQAKQLVQGDKIGKKS